MLLNSIPPLPDRMRPSHLDDLVGQDHLVGKNGIIRKAIETGNVPSMILWGPPGVGKTTIANIIANEVKRPFHTLSAVNAGVKDVREVIDDQMMPIHLKPPGLGSRWLAHDGEPISPFAIARHVPGEFP